MNVVHLSSSDVNGGAAIAALRICKAQQNIPELNSKLLVQSKKSNDQLVHSLQQNIIQSISIPFRFFLDELSIRLLTKTSRGRFTFPFFGTDITKLDLIRNSDIINLHWINGGFLSLKSLKILSDLNKPIVWTLHDMWAFTGGCHYTSSCEKFKEHCYDCPSLIFSSANDASNKIFLEKLKLFEKLNLTIVTCSRWLVNEAAKSKLLSGKKLLVIPNPLDINVFKPINKNDAKIKLGLPLDKKLVLIGAMNLKDERKGFKYLIDALNNIYKTSNRLAKEIELVVFGKLDENVINKIPFKVHQLGKLKSNEEIVNAYNATNVYVAPSLEDNLPNTIMESMACGVPVVAFNVGGIPDMIDDAKDGFLAKLKSASELANGIENLLIDEELNNRFSISAREKVVSCFNSKKVAEKYFEVYNSLV